MNLYHHSFETDGLGSSQHISFTPCDSSAENNAAQVLASLEAMLNRGESGKALILLENLPEVLLLDNPTFYMHYVWALLCERRFEEAKIAREFFEANSYRLLADVDSEAVKLFATNTAVLGLLQFIFENDLN
ncbi:MAG: hypothetical protein MI867_06165, partial [Pseudomonadales bacterium]|nr:hypothetical protein [Pseudomonadales bacterium]